MKKENICKFLYAVSILSFVGFAIRLGADFYQYDATENSAPFYLFVIARAVEFVAPGLIVLILAKMHKKKCNDK